MEIKVGDIVARKSYQFDLLFKVTEITHDQTVYLFGEEVRLIADAPYDDLVLVDENERQKRQRTDREKVDHSYRLFRQDYQLIRQKNEYHATGGYSNDTEFFQIPGRVLHIDGDPNYLKKCLALYEKIGVPVYGVHCHEKEMPDRIDELLDKYRPDILVITGHDAYSKSKGKVTELKAYRHSRHFAQTVRQARKRVPHLDQLVIFAGACQSHFESLIRAGANYASSPSRVNIHALDPVYIVAKICFTPFDERINVWDVLRNTLTGEKGLGGIETKGVLRTGMPYQKLVDEEEGDL
ncbi:sporulation peptidase YabG [Fredinandcohnia salidurans]|uniref:Sporulation peptidase YabG n=1 Tax=Fredinandcohnia salidurans TaxID=2595041 RepID=A0ABW4MLT0_9BACI|nr:sporulation peptidase YabG [Fredinandcohnia onubensis]